MSKNSSAPGWLNTYWLTEGCCPVCGRSSSTQCGFGKNRTSTTISASIGRPYLKPKDSTVTLICATDSLLKARSMAARNAGTGRDEVSITRSAEARIDESSARSAAMPSASVWPPCSGWLRRLFSYRRTRLSSDASRKSTRGLIPRVARSARTDSRSPVKPRDRTSITTAS
ncbi:Uncharacterised protein [Mycobacteroides abscessus subsp. abscessus]|nr:Uncharacterised protein [Mycobacteroides abscessus subsp. abscessus]